MQMYAAAQFGICTSPLYLTSLTATQGVGCELMPPPPTPASRSSNTPSLFMLQGCRVADTNTACQMLLYERI